MEHPIIKTIKSRMVAIKAVEDLTYLDLSRIECKVLPKEAKILLEKCHNLQELILNDCGLESLENFPNLQISILQLSSNNLTEKHLHNLSIYIPTLEQINLQHNKISDLSIMSIFSPFSRLEEINLKGNPICSIFPNYNELIFTSILFNHQSLKIVDYFRKNGEIISDEDGNDDELDGPMWMMNENIEEEDSSVRSDGNSHSQSNSENSMDKKSNMIKLYEEGIKNQPGFMVKYLNENERFIDPVDNCFDEEMEYEDEEDEDDFKNEIEKGGFKFKQSKKRKCEYRFNENEEY